MKRESVSPEIGWLLDAIRFFTNQFKARLTRNPVREFAGWLAAQYDHVRVSLRFANVRNSTAVPDAFRHELVGLGEAWLGAGRCHVAGALNFAST